MELSPKAPSFGGRLRRKTHRYGGEPAQAGGLQLLGLKPGKTIVQNGAREARAVLGDQHCTHTETTQRGSRAPAPTSWSAKQPRIAGRADMPYENRSILNGAISTGGVFAAAIAAMISEVIGASVSPRCACPNA